MKCSVQLLVIQPKPSVDMPSLLMPSLLMLNTGKKRPFSFAARFRHYLC